MTDIYVFAMKKKNKVFDFNYTVFHHDKILKYRVAVNDDMHSDYLCFQDLPPL